MALDVVAPLVGYAVGFLIEALFIDVLIRTGAGDPMVKKKTCPVRQRKGACETRGGHTRILVHRGSRALKGGLRAGG